MVLPGNLDRAPKVMLSRSPGQPNCAPGQPESCSWAIGSTLVRNPFIREHARARGTTGNRSQESNQNHTLTATAELRTYKINLLGKMWLANFKVYNMKYGMLPTPMLEPKISRFASNSIQTQCHTNLRFRILDRVTCVLDIEDMEPKVHLSD